MTLGISCFFNGCNKPVIGQCSGYNGNCGVFYCDAHSVEKLCKECGNRKTVDDRKRNADEAENQVYQEYLDAARRLREKDPTTATFLQTVKRLILVFTSSFCVAIIADHNTVNLRNVIFTAIGVFSVFELARLIKLGKRQVKEFKQSIAELDRRKPGFLKFYQTYEKIKNKEGYDRLKEVTAILIGTAAAGIGEGVRSMARSDNYNDPMVNELRGLRDDIRRKL